MKKFIFAVLILFVSFSLSAKFIVFSNDYDRDGFVPYYHVNDGYIGLSDMPMGNSVVYEENESYYLILNAKDVKIASILEGEGWKLVSLRNKSSIDFQKGQIVKLTFENPLIIRPKSISRLSVEPDYAFLDSISSYISSDTMYKIVSILSGNEPYSSGFVSKTRFITQEGCDSAAIYLYNRFLSYGMDTVFYEEFAGTTDAWVGSKPYTTRNVIAIKRGSRTSDTCVVVGGHFDSISEPYDYDTTTAPGADDNASGTAGVHEVARIFSQLNLDNEIDIYFIDFSAEEIGLIGSYRFIEDYLKPRGIYVKGMINMDMISYNDDSGMVDVHGSGFSQSIRDVYIDIGRNITSLSLIAQPSTYGSDHYYFEQNGYRSVFAIEGDYYTYSGYHTPGDTIGWLDFSFARDIARTSLATAYYVANCPSVVENVYVVDNGDSSITVTWNKLLDDDITGYKVYYHTYYGEILYVEVGDTNSARVYPVLPDSLYYVGVVGIDTMGFEGFVEEEDTITPSFIPHPVSITDYYSDKEKMYLYWNKSSCADFKDYIVLRKVSEKWDTIAIVTDTAFIDSTVSDTMIYWYSIIVEDSSGYQSDIVDSVSLRLITMQNDIVVVDETFNSRLWTDSETDAFYRGIFNDYPIIDVDSIDEVGLAQFGNSKVIFYIDDDNVNLRNKLNKEHLEKYIENGGKFILCGWEIADKMDGYPYIPHYCDSSEILYSLFGVTMFDKNTDYDLEYAVYNINGEDTIHFNTDIVGNEYLQDVDVFEFVSDFTPFGYYKSASGSSYDGKSIMAMNNDTSVIISSLPLYCMEYYDAKRFVADILSLYELPLYSDDVKENVNRRINLVFYMKDNIIDVNSNVLLHDVKVFDITGRSVSIKAEGLNTNRVRVSIKDKIGKGIYFVKVYADDEEYIKKIVNIY